MSVETIDQAEVTELSFNLWDASWIGVLFPSGGVQQASIRECLTQAHELQALCDPSPLVVAGVQRLLAAILQDIYRPETVEDLARLLGQGSFDPLALTAYADRYRAGFDLFAPGAPFMQTADAPLEPAKGDAAKPVSTLFFEQPSATNVVHFWHAYDGEHAVCPACAAGGLLVQPAFATAGGSGIRPSINGVPPIYVLPAGATLFETLVFALIVPDYQPEIRDRSADRPPWAAGQTVITRGEEATRVGYLESLTFPARRMRLHPRRAPGACTRCGQPSDVLIATLLYEMGRSRPKAAPPWLDPFAAYRRSGDDPPKPVRPQQGKVLWREYSTLFLSARRTRVAGGRAAAKVKAETFYSPAVVSQLADLEDAGRIRRKQLLQFRCIGMRTDMKAKIFDWTDETLDLPAGLLGDPRGARGVQRAIERAEQLDRDIKAIFQQHLRPDPQGKRDRFVALRERMAATYWTRLAAPFREYVLAAGGAEDLDQAGVWWSETILRTAGDCFAEAVAEVGERGNELRKRAQALQACRYRLAARRKEWIDAETESKS